MKQNRQLADLEEKFADRNTIWTNLDNFRKQQNVWFNSNMNELDVDEIERYMKVKNLLAILPTHPSP